MPSSTTPLNSNNSMHNIDMRKKEPKNVLSVSDKKLLQICFENRNRIYQGLRLLKSIIHENSSKLVIYICSYLAKKIQHFNCENGETLKKFPMGQ
jgi:hypothetical protein